MVTYDLALPVPATGEVPTETQCRLAQAAEGAGYDHVPHPRVLGPGGVRQARLLRGPGRDDRPGDWNRPRSIRDHPASLHRRRPRSTNSPRARTLLGLGLSGPAVIENWHGVEFEPALRRQRETIKIVRQVLSGEEISYDGKPFDLEHFHLRFDPPRANLGIYVAAQGETNVELAGGFGDG